VKRIYNVETMSETMKGTKTMSETNIIVDFIVETIYNVFTSERN